MVCCSLCIGVFAGGCNLFDDVDGYEEASDENDAGDGNGEDADAGKQGGTLSCDNAQTLCVRLASFGPRVTQLVGVDLVNEDGFLRARAVLDPATSGQQSADIIMPLAIDETEVPAQGEKSPLHLEIFADVDGDREYTDADDDGWKVPLPASGHVLFQHNRNFMELSPRPKTPGGDFHIQFSEMGVHEKAMLEVIVIEAVTGRAVGFYRMQEIPGDEFEITIPGIIDVGGVVYRAEFFADANGNYVYDDPKPDGTSDHTWASEQPFESNSKGATTMFVHGTNFKVLPYLKQKFKP